MHLFILVYIMHWRSWIPCILWLVFEYSTHIGDETRCKPGPKPCCSAGVEGADCLELSMFDHVSWDNSSLVRVWKPESMDWYWRETITGKPHISWQKPMVSCSALPIQWQQRNALWSHISWSASVKQLGSFVLYLSQSWEPRICMGKTIYKLMDVDSPETWKFQLWQLAVFSSYHNAKLGCPS